jgi:CspA family cold shock protein|tara:strand:- start:256 stop:558 length:303 start_codon:yes stop_codon:yes gene_type:complete
MSEQTTIYQVKWFSKKKGYGFVEDSDSNEFFVHHTDIKVDGGFRYLKQGEYICGTKETMTGDKVKLAEIRAPMTNGMLICEVEKKNNSQSNSGDAIDSSE